MVTLSSPALLRRPVVSGCLVFHSLVLSSWWPFSFAPYLTERLRTHHVSSSSPVFFGQENFFLAKINHLLSLASPH